MLKEEFEKRTGIRLRTELYECVEQGYYKSELDKDAFCKEFLKNHIPWLLVKAEELILQYKLLAEQKEKTLKETTLSHQKEIEKLEKQYERLWGSWEIESKLSDEDYSRLEKSCLEEAARRGNSFCDSYFLDYIEGFGFDRNKVILRKVSEKSHCGIYVRTRECDKRKPMYFATDWNFVPFSCGRYNYEIVDGELYLL